MPRLDQFLASLGYGSRREVRSLIAAGRATVRGAPAADPGEKISDDDEVQVDGQPLDHPDGLLLMLHKPAGLVCSHDAREGPSVYDLLPPRWRRRHPPVTSIGRLDKETTGLLLLTDQTILVHRLTSPRHKVPKTYRAGLDREVTAAQAEEITAVFAGGTLVLDGEREPCKPAELRWRDPRSAELILHEGRYHQVRRMFASRGCTVVSLHRERFGPLELGGLSPGAWRELPMDFFSREDGAGPGDGKPAPAVHRGKQIHPRQP
ncbi:MAG TPA: pseudouridine synthase [Opitutaceae bacterium]|nr:pseudouridine synthase [Opitutaceae bacterium]